MYVYIHPCLQEPIPTTHIAKMLNNEAMAAFRASEAAYWAECAAFLRPGVVAPPAGGCGAARTNGYAGRGSHTWIMVLKCAL